MCGCMNVFYMCCNTTKNYYSNINIFYENATSIFLCILLIARETERERERGRVSQGDRKKKSRTEKKGKEI